MWGWLKRKKKQSWVCRVCGQVHDEFPTDFGWLLPDEIWALGEEVRKEKLDWATDVCFHEDRWFIRGVLEVPFNFHPGRWGWGVWAEVDHSVVQKLWALGDSDGSEEPRESGVLACTIPLFPDSMGLPLEVQFGPGDKRPLFYMPADCHHQLALEQRLGLDEPGYHRVLEAVTSR